VDIEEQPVAASPSATVERVEEEDVGHGSSRICYMCSAGSE
jgi:hypothetical protein